MTDWKKLQNPDGGWAYSKGCSWTEPTALVLLAQTVTGLDQDSFAAGLRYLHSTQRSDGGWSPQSGVAESTWVTALVALLPPEALGAARLTAALHWLEGQTGRESSWTFRLQQMLAGNKEKYPEGWPWFPGAAAWVIPTSLGILAFERALTRGADSALRSRVLSGRDFLFNRICADGGWNHGSNRALGRDGDSYPETTGIALTALHRAALDSPEQRETIERAKRAARQHLAACRTAEGIAWLRMGLAAHGEDSHGQETPPEPRAQASGPQPRLRTTTDAALMALAAASRNPLVS